MRRTCALSAVVALAAALAGAAAADRLVLADGSSVETRGPWRVEGRMVIFHLPNGALSSLRLDAVDLEATETIRRERPAAEPLPSVTTSTKPRPVLVVTDRDVKRAAAPPATATAEDDVDGAPSADGAETPAAGDGDAVVIAARDLEVSTIEVSQNPRGGLEVTGLLHNRGVRVVTDAEVSVTVRSTYDGERTYQAVVADDVLAAGGRSSFRILLPDVFAIDEDGLRFDLRGKAVRPRIIGSAFTEPASDDSVSDP